MIAHTIEAAIETNLFDRVLVSTEDAEIAKVSQTWGAEVHHRDESLAQDSSRVVEVCRAVLDHERRRGWEHSVICSLYATAPLRTTEDISATLALLEPGECEFAMAITKYGLPPHQALTETSNGFLEAVNSGLVTQRVDTMDELWVDNGSTYAAMVSGFERQGSFFGPGLRGHKMARARSIDINDLEDLELVRVTAEWLSTKAISG